ncbi:nucleoporin [Musa troglodytarum]|uniref:Nucleoporin n=1 Tax=Musa troglodytarum TaxID=320322 RepID=A0A9E7EB60_9LILI|nr:nucleoporin [Musa troglodytarum]
MFGTPSASSVPAFGALSSTPAFGTPSSTPAFGTPSATPAFGTPSSTPAFGTPSATPAFGTPSSTPAFGAPSSTPSFATPTPSPFFSQQQQQLQPFGFQPTPSPFGNAQITTQMAPVAALQLPLADRDIHAILDAYKEEPGNPKYSFRHLLLSVTDPALRVKPVGASDIMWAEAMTKLEGMDSSDRDRLWPQLVQGFKDLSNRLKVSVLHSWNLEPKSNHLGLVLVQFETGKLSGLFDFDLVRFWFKPCLACRFGNLQDEVLVSDAERLRMTQANVKLLQRHFQVDTLQWTQRLKQKEQVLLRRLLRILRIVEALESKGYRMPLMKGEAELAEKLAAIARQLKGPGAELSRRVHNLVSISRARANTGELNGSIYIPGSAKIREQSLADLQEVLQQETEAIARLGNVLKRDTRDLEIIMSEGTDPLEDDRGRSLMS